MNQGNLIREFNDQLLIGNSGIRLNGVNANSPPQKHILCEHGLFQSDRYPLPSNATIKCYRVVLEVLRRLMCRIWS